MKIDLEKEIDLIKERNKRVELDKAWETSLFRVGFISLITYVITAIVFYFLASEGNKYSQIFIAKRRRKYALHILSELKTFC